MLSNAYFLAKFRFDTAENEPAKICKICKIFAKFANFANLTPLVAQPGKADRGDPCLLLREEPVRHRLPETPSAAWRDRETLE